MGSGCSSGEHSSEEKKKDQCCSEESKTQHPKHEHGSGKGSECCEDSEKKGESDKGSSSCCG